ncbi:MAG TPA: hypothetical protein VGJ20_43570 [Xanthobacteraceae bacterium]|jgi:hypothetical protein
MYPPIRKVSSLLWLGFSTIVLYGCADSYATLLAKQGYTVMDHPRSEFGTGTIVRRSARGEQIYIASADECFPGLSIKVHPNTIQLLDSKETSNLSVNGGGKFVPGGAQQVALSMGFKSVTTLDVSFGKTTGNDLTVEGFAEYLDGKKVTRRCLGYLSDANNRVLLSAALVESMSFNFHGERDVNAKVDASALKDALSANGVVTYSSTTDHTLIVKQPMYIAFRSFQFNDLGIPQTEEADSLIELRKGKFQLALDVPESR